jgi:hypothetical protein
LTGLTPPPAPSNVAAPNQTGATGTGQAQPQAAPDNTKKKKKNKLDQILPQILGQ